MRGTVKTCATRRENSGAIRGCAPWAARIGCILACVLSLFWSVLGCVFWRVCWGVSRSSVRGLVYVHGVRTRGLVVCCGVGVLVSGVVVCCGGRSHVASVPCPTRVTRRRYRRGGIPSSAAWDRELERMA